MARDTTWKRKLFEQMLHAIGILGNIRVILAVSTLKISISDQAWSPMTRTSDVDHVLVILLDDAVEVDIDKVETWSSTPMS